MRRLLRRAVCFARRKRNVLFCTEPAAKVFAPAALPATFKHSALEANALSPNYAAASRLPSKPPSPPAHRLVPPPPPSNFTAVTPSGESASISVLREKQALRRLKAMQFLLDKQSQVGRVFEECRSSSSDLLRLTLHWRNRTAQDEKATKADAVEEKPLLDSAASEDIFDLTLSPSPPEDPSDMVRPCATEVMAFCCQVLNRYWFSVVARSFPDAGVVGFRLFQSLWAL